MAGRRADEDGSTAAGFVAGAVVVAAALYAVNAYGLLPDRSAPPPDPPPVAPQQPATFQEAYREVADGVVRIGNTRCEGGGMGSGALVADDLVATSAHVVHDHAALQLILGDQVATGEVVAYEPAADLAIVRASRPLTGHVFTVADTLPGVGSEVAAVGYPLDGPRSMAGPGIVGTYGESATYHMGDGETIEASDLMRVSVPTNPGNSGGPVIASDGTLVGLVSGQKNMQVDEDGNVIVEDVDGIRYATTARQVQDALAALGETALPAEECEDESAPAEEDDELVSTSLAATAAGEAVRDVLFDYFDGINTSDYDRAYEQLSAGRRESLSRERFEEEQSTSVISDVVIFDVTESEDEIRAATTFTSVQAPEFGPDGLPCAYWTLEFRFVPGGEHGWAIAGSEDFVGTPRVQACG